MGGPTSEPLKEPFGATPRLTNVELGYNSPSSRRTAARLSSRLGCRGGRRPVPTGRRPGLRLRPYCCQQRQGSRIDEGLGGDASGWTRTSSSARNRFGWVKAAKWPASLISASPLVGASTSSKYSSARVVKVTTSLSPWNRKNGTSKRVPSRQAS